MYLVFNILKCSEFLYKPEKTLCVWAYLANKVFLILFDCIFILLGETIPLMADGFINKLAFKGLGLVIYYVFETRLHLFDQKFCKNSNKSYTFLQFKIIYNNLFFIINYSQNSF